MNKAPIPAHVSGIHKGEEMARKKKKPDAATATPIGLPAIPPGSMPNGATRSSPACRIYHPPDMTPYDAEFSIGYAPALCHAPD